MCCQGRGAWWGEQPAPGPGNARFGGKRIGLGDVSVFHLSWSSTGISCLPRSVRCARCSLSRARCSNDAILRRKQGKSYSSQVRLGGVSSVVFRDSRDRRLRRSNSQGMLRSVGNIGRSAEVQGTRPQVDPRKVDLGDVEAL